MTLVAPEHPVIDHSTDENCLRVAGGTNVQALASSIANCVMEGNPPILRAIGAGAVNQAQKALAVARGIVAVSGVDLYVKPGFISILNDDNEQRSAMTFRVIVER